ncbi:MAG: PAS domain S-box protein, partial [Ignavibacteria bacterium]|nr:PAS domain S-box protein [Ignavibacteria bacterium]
MIPSVNKISIKYKLTFIILAVTVSSLGIGLGISLFNNITTYREDLVNNTRLNSVLIGENCISPLAFGDREEAGRILERIKSIPNFLAGAVYDEHGKLFAFTRINHNDTLPYQINPTESYSFSKNSLSINSVIVYKGKFYGNILLLISLDTLHARIKNLVLVTVVLLLLLMILSFIGARQIQKIISDPILRLAAVTQKISTDADYKVRVIKKDEDEIGQLYDGFNEMLNQITFREEERDKIESELRQSEERYKTLFLSNPSMFFTLGIDGTIISTNNFGAMQLGYGPYDLEGSSYYELTYEPDQQIIRDQIKNCSRNPSQLYHSIFRKIRKDGKILWIEEFARAITQADGHTTIFVSCSDITERKRTEEALLKSEEKYKALYLNNPSMYLTLDATGIITSVNEFGARQLGYEIREMLNKPLSDFYSTGDILLIQENLSKSMQNPGELQLWEARRQRKDGSVIWVEEYARSISELDTSMNVFVASTDITNRKYAAEALQRSEEYYRTIFEHTGTPLVFIAENDIISLVNREFELLSGFTKSDIEEKMDWKSFFVLNSEFERMVNYHHLRKIDPSAVPHSYECKLKKFDGDTRIVHVTISTIPGTHNLLAAFLDITERILLERSLKENERKLTEIIDGSPVPQFFIDKEHRVIYWNKALEVLTGVPK